MTGRPTIFSYRQPLLLSATTYNAVCNTLAEVKGTLSGTSAFGQALTNYAIPNIAEAAKQTVKPLVQKTLQSGNRQFVKNLFK